MSLGKEFIKRYCLPVFTGLHLEKVLSSFTPYNMLVLAYHGIEPSPNYGFNKRNLPSEQFEKHLQYFAKNFSVVPLSEIFSLYKSGQKPKQKTVALTFDDGYVNNLTHALPLLVKYNLPATIFIVSSSLIDEEYIVWSDWFDIAKYYSPEKEFIIDGLSFERFNNILYCKEIKAYIYEYIKKMGNTRDKILNDFIEKYNVKSYLQKDRQQSWKMVNKEELKQLANSPLINIGAHSHLHYNMGYISDELAKNEFKKSKSIIENVLQKSIDTFAFPDGSYNENTKKIAHECGFKNLVAVDYRLAEDKDDKNIISRHTISNTINFEQSIISIHSAFNTQGL